MIENSFKGKDKGFYHWTGSTPFLLWQNATTGAWTLATMYGLMEHIDIGIKKDQEWLMRSSMFLGWFNPLGRGVQCKPLGMVYTRSKLLQGHTKLKFKDIQLEIVAYTAHHDIFKQQLECLRIGQELWLPTTKFHDFVRIFDENIVSVLPQESIEEIVTH